MTLTRSGILGLGIKGLGGMGMELWGEGGRRGNERLGDGSSRQNYND